MNSTELGFITAAVRNYMLYIKISSDKDRDKKKGKYFLLYNITTFCRRTWNNTSSREKDKVK